MVVIGHQKGRDTEENIAPELRDAASRGLPQGAPPDAARRHVRQADPHASSTRPAPIPGSAPRSAARPRRSRGTCGRWRGCRRPIIAVVTGEGGSGGALALGVGDRVLMLEYAIYSVISPEGCAAILWGDAAKAPRTPPRSCASRRPICCKLGVIDGIIPEPPGGAHRNWAAAARAIQSVVAEAFGELAGSRPSELVQQRYAKFRRMGIFEETT